MFDRTTIVTRPQPVHADISINERRAPTDESVKLLREMESAARSRVIDAVKVGDSQLECVVHYERDLMSGDAIFLAIISVNGGKLRVESRTRCGETIQDRVHQLIQDVAKALAEAVVAPALVSLPALARGWK